MRGGADKIMMVLGGSFAACSVFGGWLLGEPSLFFAALPSFLLLFIPLLDALQEKSLSSVEAVSLDFQTAKERARDERACQIRELYGLTDREEEVMVLLARGFTRNAIGEMLYLSRNTVDTHIRSIYTKLDCHKKDEVIRMLEVEPGEAFGSVARKVIAAEGIGEFAKVS